MDSALKMRCLMWRFSVHIDFLATGLMLQYSFAHGNETGGALSPLPGGLHRNPVNERVVGLYQLSGIEAGDAKIRGRDCAVHSAGAGSKAGVSRGVLQWVGQRQNSDERDGWRFLVGGRCTAETRRTRVHVFDRRSAMAHSACGRRFCNGRFWADQRGCDRTVGQ